MSRTTQAAHNRLGKWYPILLIVCSIIGLIASFIISYEKEALLKNPKFRPGCDLNPIISCGSVMSSPQGSVFGFPNAWIGLVGFGVLITVGVGVLAGARYARWFWLTMLTTISAGLVFAYWLLYQSMFNIHALCPYCLTVDVMVITLAWYTKLYLIDQGIIRIPAKLKAVAGFGRKHHLDLFVLWLLIVTAFIIHHFWYYFGRNF